MSIANNLDTGVVMNLAATGGTSNVLQQTTVGGAISVGQLSASNLSNGVTGSGALVLATSPTIVTPTIATIKHTTAISFFIGATIGTYPLSIDGNGINIDTGNNIRISGDIVLTSTTLGSTVVNSSLTSVGTITSGAWNSSTKIGLAYGGTNADLSATGGTGHVLKQESAGAAITVGAIAAGDLSNGTTGSGPIVLQNGATLGSLTVATTTTATITNSGATDHLITTDAAGFKFKVGLYGRIVAAGSTGSDTALAMATFYTNDNASNTVYIQSGTTGKALTIYTNNKLYELLSVSNTGLLNIINRNPGTQLLSVKDHLDNGISVETYGRTILGTSSTFSTVKGMVTCNSNDATFDTLWVKSGNPGNAIVVRNNADTANTLTFNNTGFLSITNQTVSGNMLSIKDTSNFGITINSYGRTVIAGSTGYEAVAGMLSCYSNDGALHTVYIQGSNTGKSLLIRNHANTADVLHVDNAGFLSLVGGNGGLNIQNNNGTFSHFNNAASSLNYIRGLGTSIDSPTTISSSLTMSSTGTNAFLLLNRLTTAGRDAISGITDGMIIYNTSTGTFQGRAGGAWVNL